MISFQSRVRAPDFVRLDPVGVSKARVRIWSGQPPHELRGGWSPNANTHLAYQSVSFVFMLAHAAVDPID